MNTQKVYLDNLNTKRVENTRRRVAHAICLLNSFTLYTCLKAENFVPSQEQLEELLNNVSHAINLLEAAEEEMKWACEHFSWDDGVCFQLNDAVFELGKALAMASYENGQPQKIDWAECGCFLKDGVILLTKALATLQRWFDDDADVSEI